MEKMKLTKLEKSWVLYDIGNSAFILLVSTLLPIYFNALASGAGLSESDYLAYWGYAGSVATILVAFIGSIAVLFVIGFLLFCKADKLNKARVSV